MPSPAEKHTPGAIRAAEIITGGEYGSWRLYVTTYGRKTVVGIADLIDRQTGAAELCRALRLAEIGFRQLAQESANVVGWNAAETKCPLKAAEACRIALAKARERKP